MKTTETDPCPPDPDPLARITAALAGRYRLKRTLGAGGGGHSLPREDVQRHRDLAIKVLHEWIAHTLGTARFPREIEIASQLQHPNILTLDSGEAQGFLYYVMPYVEGHSLREWSTLSATLRWWRRSSARYSVAMPPGPSSRSMR